MHGQRFFCFRAGRGGAGAKSSWQGGATVKLGAFSGQGGILKIFVAGVGGGSHFSRGGACIPNSHKINHSKFSVFLLVGRGGEANLLSKSY